MARSPNAQLAVDIYDELLTVHGWDLITAWQGIARLLLTCDIYRREWETFHDVVVYIDSNRFTTGDSGPHATLRRAEALTEYLAHQLNMARQDLCGSIGLYWRQPRIRELQPNNLVGNAFRSLVANALVKFGSPEITYSEEVSPHTEFPGHPFPTRSKKAKIDIVARKRSRTVALISVRWRVRHDRLDVVDEAMAYAPAAQRQNPACKVYAVLGEFDGGRLRKVLDSCPPLVPTAALSAAVHFAPHLIREGLGENGTLQHLRGLDWLIEQTHSWE